MVNYHDAISELKHFIHSDSLTEAPSNETCLLAIEALREKAQQEQPNEPLTLKRFEEICESVHNGWWEEKKRQGITRHPDMLPYSELAEEVKEYDRVTVRRVLDALRIPYRHTPEQED